MVSLMVSISFSPCSMIVSRIGFSIRVGIQSSLILFLRHLLSVASLSSIFSFPPLYVQFDVNIDHYVVISNVDLVDDCYVCDDVWPVC